jgi:hypothetical protein
MPGNSQPSLAENPTQIKSDVMKKAIVEAPQSAYTQGNIFFINAPEVVSAFT